MGARVSESLNEQQQLIRRMAAAAGVAEDASMSSVRPVGKRISGRPLLAQSDEPLRRPSRAPSDEELLVSELVDSLSASPSVLHALVSELGRLTDENILRVAGPWVVNGPMKSIALEFLLTDRGVGLSPIDLKAEDWERSTVAYRQCVGGRLVGYAWQVPSLWGGRWQYRFDPGVAAMLSYSGRTTAFCMTEKVARRTADSGLTQCGWRLV